MEESTYLKSKGIHHELTVPYSPEQNGVAERMNRTLMEMARSMMAHAGLRDRYWVEAVDAISETVQLHLLSRGSKHLMKFGKGRNPTLNI